MSRGDRIFVEFFIPPPPPRSSDSESSDSENQTSDGGIEISGIDKSQSILDISAAVVERANQETRKRSGKGRTVINVNSIFNQSGESDDYVDSPIPEEDVPDSPNSPEMNSDPLFDIAPDQHLESRSSSLDSNASVVSSTSEANSIRSVSTALLKEIEEERHESISISLPHAPEDTLSVREFVTSPKHVIESRSPDTAVDSMKDQDQMHLVSTDESSSDREVTPLVSSDESEDRSDSTEPESKLDGRVDGRVDGKSDGKSEGKPESKSPMPKSPSPMPKSPSPLPKSPSSPRRNDDNVHSPTTSLSPRGTQTIVEKVMSPRTEDDESTERSYTRHSSPFEKTSSSSPMELAQDFMVMLNKSPTRSSNRSFFGNSPHGFASHSPQPPLDDIAKVEEEGTSLEDKSGSLERPFRLLTVETVSSTSGRGVCESSSSQEGPLLEENASQTLPKEESSLQQSSVNDLMNESDQMASDITGVDTPSLPSSLKESGTF